MKRVGEIPRLLRYDLNQISYDYTVELMNRFKVLDLVDRVPEELWTEVHNIVQEAITKTIPKKKKCRKAKWFSVFHGGSVVKNSPANAGDASSIPGLGRSQGEEMATHSSILAWEILWTEEPGGLQSKGSQRVRHHLGTKQQQSGCLSRLYK